jgi:hypothetical protein
MLGAMALAAFAGAAGAQTSATTTCMMTCNSQAASCQSAFADAVRPPLLAAQIPGANSTASTSCVLSQTVSHLFPTVSDNYEKGK